MLLQEMGQVNKQSFNKVLITLANDIYTIIGECSEVKAYLDGLTDDDLGAMLPDATGGTVGFSAETIAYMRTFGVALLNMVEAYNNTTKTGSASPAYITNIMKNPVA